MVEKYSKIPDGYTLKIVHGFLGLFDEDGTNHLVAVPSTVSRSEFRAQVEQLAPVIFTRSAIEAIIIAADEILPAA